MESHCPMKGVRCGKLRLCSGRICMLTLSTDVFPSDEELYFFLKHQGIVSNLSSRLASMRAFVSLKRVTDDSTQPV